MEYKISLTFFDGSRDTYKAADPNLYGLMRDLEKCVIKSFKIELS